MLFFVDVKRHVQQNPCPSEEIFASMQLQTEAVLLRQTSGIYIHSFLPISTTRCVLIKMLKKQILLFFQEEVIQLILSYLDIPSLCMASVTSK